jgi:hypothetical protein
MPKSTNLCHSVTAAIAVTQRTAFAYLSDPLKLGNWTLGSADTRPAASEGLVEGRSRFDDSRSLIRIDSDPKRGIIDYYVGTRPRHLSMRISARILEGESFGMGSDCCLVTLLAWRPVGMDKTRWHRLCASHEVEILLAKSQLENNG